MNWKTENSKWVKEFEFQNFIEAINFVNKIVPLAEHVNHHPDILIYSYKKVRIELVTHSKEKITQKDYDLAERIDKIE